MLKVFQKVLQRLKDKCLALGYEMLLEADVSGWLFHLFLTQPKVNWLQIHLDTRICNAKGFFDVVIGPLQTIANGRPCVNPQLVIEVKIFPIIGFTDQQHRVHYEHILNDDFPKLGRLDSTIELCAALIMDGRGYLEGTYQGCNRREHLIKIRNKVASGVHVFIMRLTDGNWQIEHEAPEAAHNIR